jgi:hypothetical protein
MKHRAEVAVELGVCINANTGKSKLSHPVKYMPHFVLRLDPRAEEVSGEHFAVYVDVMTA